MKNKLIINIILVYFALLAVVLVVQMRSRKTEVSTEPLKDSVKYSDVLSDCVVLYDRSPVMLVRQKQRLVSGGAGGKAPVAGDNGFTVPLDFFREAYGAVVSYDKDRDTATVRLNNRAMVVDGKKGIITLISASKEKELETKGSVEIINGSAYIPLDGFAEAFDKELNIYESMALLSDKELKLKDNRSIEGLSAEVEPQVKNLPSVDEQKKLEELLGSGAVNIFNAIGETIGIPQEDDPVSTLGLDAAATNAPAYIKTDGEYVYFIRDNSLNIARAGERPETVSSTELDFTDIEGIYISGSYVSVIGACQWEETGFKGCGIAAYDVSDKTAPKIARRSAAEGACSAVYKKDDTAYLFVKKEAESAESLDMPSCYDSANADVGSVKSLSRVRYVPEMADKSYTTILSFNIKDMARAVNVYTVLGCGDNYSVTGGSVYIAASADEKGASVYKLALEEDGVKYSAAAYIEADIPDSSCMNEYNGILRLASRTEEDTAAITLFDDKMDELSSLRDISLKGSLVSARFIGSRGYLVSDSKSEPVYSADLSRDIKELGFINIPEDTAAVRNLDAEHFVCVKKDGSISMLNIADMSNQKEIFSTNTKGKSDSGNILLNAEEDFRLLAIPVELDTLEVETESVSEAVSEGSTQEEASAETESQWETTSASNQETEPEPKAEKTFGDPVWQGVYVYSLTDEGFELIDKISHMDGEYNSQAVINNMLYKDNRLYTVSQKEIKSNCVK